MLKAIRNRVTPAYRILLNGEGSRRARKNIPAISAEEVAEAKSFFPLKKFFIFGHARSGTTLLVRLIRLHPEVHCNYQAHFFTRPPLLQSLVSDPEIEAWLTRRSNRWNHGQDLSPLVLRVVADFIMEREARREGKSIVGDKSPNNLLNGEAVRLLHKVYPEACLIFIIRDGRDAVVSHRFQSFIDASQHLSLEDLRIREEFSRDPEPFLQGKRSIFTPKVVRWAADGWARNITKTDQAAKELYAERYLSLRFDDLLNHPLAEMQRVWAFLGADPETEGLAQALWRELGQNPDSDWQREVAGELIEPLLKGKSGSWRNLFTANDRQVFKEVAGQVLVDWGFEKDLNW